MANLNADFPQITARLVNPDGTITEAWYIFLVQIFRRTGGTGGGGSSLTPDEIIDASFAQIPLNTPYVSPEVSLPEGTFTPPVSNNLLAECVTPPGEAIKYFSESYAPSGNSCALTETISAQSFSVYPLDDIIFAPQPLEMPSEAFSLPAPLPSRSVVATRRQALSIDGGVVTSISISRGSWSRNLSTSTEMVEMNTGDIVTLAYSVAPTLTALPR